MNLVELSQAVQGACGTVPADLAVASAAARQAHEAVGHVRTEAAAARQRTEAGLARIPPAAQALGDSLREGRARVERASASVEEGVARLEGVVAQAETDLGQASSELRSQAELLLAALPAAAALVHVAAEDRRSRLDAERRAVQAAHEALAATLADAAARVQRLIDQTGGLRTQAQADVATATQALGALAPGLAPAREGLATGAAAAGRDLSQALADLQQTVVGPRTDALAADVRALLDTRVSDRARRAADALREEAVEPMARQLLQHEQEVGPERQAVERSLKELQGGPQLRPLIRDSKHVLQKVGKLGVLGPLASSL